MTATEEKKTCSEKARRPLTREERLEKARKKILSSKEEARKFLIEVGILDENGKPSEIYYS